MSESRGASGNAQGAREIVSLGAHTTAVTCLMCAGARWSREWTAREMQFGLPGEFTYGQCERCASLQLLTPPRDPGVYYPGGYYSLSDEGASPTGIVARLRAEGERFAVTRRGLLGRAVAAVNRPKHTGLWRWLRLSGVTASSPILDVGCGTGALLRVLAAAGYRSLTGVDPYLDADRDDRGVRLLKGTVDAVAGPFALIMLHHSLEHVADPAATLAAVRRLLAPGGHCLVRVPIVPCTAFGRYGGNWVQIDAPRHVSVPAADALVALARRSGFALAALRHDSAGIQFWGSELYAQGLTLSAGARSVPWAVKQRARVQAAIENARRRGDQAGFLFRAA